LLEIGRNFLEAKLPRPRRERLTRRWLLRVVPNARRLRRWLRLGRMFRHLLPARLASAVGAASGREADRELAAGSRSHSAPTQTVAVGGRSHSVRRVLLLNGCVQQAATPGVNAALTRLLESRGIEVEHAPDERCCGSLALHLGA